MNFSDFSLHETLMQNISAMGFTQATDIQVQVMPMALEGKDVSGLSRTGTGKTAAFLIPTIQRLTTLGPDRLALFLAPTRELAQQIMEESEKLSKGLNMGSVTIVGGMSSEDQIKALQNGARLVAGTPGRVIDLFKERALDLSKVDVLVFDEADRMFDMGFIKDMQYILSKVNPQRQILLFSATMNFSVLNMLYEYGANPQEINVSRDQMTADKIEQVLYHVGDREKPNYLLAVCNKHAPGDGTVIVFVNYKERVPWVAAFLTKNGIPAQGLSSLMRQEKRNKIIQGFKTGKFRALVATDVASRGLDVDSVSLVVNYHLPEEAATYVHRIGRTARAGKDGIAVAISSSEDAYNQIRIEEFLKHQIPVQWLAEEEVPKEVKMPGRGEVEDDESGDENAVGSGGVPPSSRGGRDRGPRGRGGERGGRDRGPRDRAPRERRPHASDVHAPGRGPVAPEEVAAPSTEGIDDISSPPASLPRLREEGAPPREARAPRQDRPMRDDRNGERDRDADRGGRDRGPREERHAREDRPREDRGGRDRDRGGRDRGGRDRDRGGRDRGRGRDRGDRGHYEGPSVSKTAPADLPSPLTGNPIIYDMATGKPKNRSAQEYKSLVNEYDRTVKNAEEKFAGKKKAAPAIIKKISSKVTALFGKRGE